MSKKPYLGKPKGFGILTPERRREIASKGGKAAHRLGLAHEWNSTTGQAAGRKSGSKKRRAAMEIVDGE